MNDTEAQNWAVEPLNMAKAARVLGICRRHLTDVLKQLNENSETEDLETHERRGVKKIFYPEHIANIRNALKCPQEKPKPIMPRSGSKKRKSGPSTSPSKESEFAAALESVRKGPKEKRSRKK